MVDLKVVVYDGSYHDVDSSEIAFKIAASMALQGSGTARKARDSGAGHEGRGYRSRQLLGAATGDLNSRRGQILNVTDRGSLGLKVIDARVPLSEMFGYATSMRSFSQGRANFNMTFSHYDPVPGNITAQIQEGKK